MKKLFITASIALFMLSSCSDDDAATTNTSSMLPTKIVTSPSPLDEDGSLTEILTYDGNKILKDVMSNGTYEEFTYSGNNITAIKTYTSGTNALLEEELFTYNGSNQLTTHVYNSYESSQSWKTNFTYNSNGTISTTEYEGDLNSPTDLYGSGVITVINGNVTQYSILNDGETEPYVTSFTFDNKNSHYKNITGMDAVNIAFLEGGVNNILTRNDGGYVSTTVYQYNADGYPTSFVETGEEFDDVITTQVTY